MDPTLKLPGLSRKTEAELRDLYTQEVGTAVPTDLTTADGLRAAIKAHRNGAPDDEEVLTAAKPSDSITVVDNETQLEQELPLKVWKELGVAQENYTVKADKPAELG